MKYSDLDKQFVPGNFDGRCVTGSVAVLFDLEPDSILQPTKGGNTERFSRFLRRYGYRQTWGGDEAIEDMDLPNNCLIRGANVRNHGHAVCIKDRGAVRQQPRTRSRVSGLSGLHLRSINQCPNWDYNALNIYRAVMYYYVSKKHDNDNPDVVGVMEMMQQLGIPSRQRSPPGTAAGHPYGVQGWRQ